jgi:hypothetical protein
MIMSDNPGPLKEIIEKRNAAIEADAALRRSPDYIAALKSAETIADNYAVARGVADVDPFADIS